MGGEAATFQPDLPLTQGALTELVAGLTAEPASSPSSSEAPVTMAALDASLVKGLGLRDASSAFIQGARAAGLVPPSRFGTEAVARLLGLRTNHPAGQDSLELLPRDPATRAEAAFSAARVLGFQGSEEQAVRDEALTFQLPELTPWQRQILHTAVSFIGYPYIWGGTSENAQTPLGMPTPGGFDCSGFVWRVYKLEPYPGEGPLASMLRGRTTFQMSVEVPASKRIHFADLQPADVIFFGDKGPRSQSAEVRT